MVPFVGTTYVQRKKPLVYQQSHTWNILGTLLLDVGCAYCNSSGKSGRSSPSPEPLFSHRPTNNHMVTPQYPLQSKVCRDHKIITFNNLLTNQWTQQFVTCLVGGTQCILYYLEHSCGWGVVSVFHDWMIECMVTRGVVWFVK